MRVTRLLLVVAALGATVMNVRCGSGTSPRGPASPSDVGAPVPAPTPPSPPAATQTFVGAGDLARCDALDPARQTAQLLGHDHLYERFGPQDADGRADALRGIRQFTVGTGGAGVYEFVTQAPNSEARRRAFGVLKLTLDADRYEWQFIEVSGAVSDAGAGSCH